MNALSFSVLRSLADGGFHSGAFLADALGVSRGTIWNAVRALQATGLDVYKVPGRGYKLPHALSLLDRERIIGALGDAARRVAVDVVDCVESTSTTLLERARAGAVSGNVVAAEWQTRGRGRLGRAWHASPGGSLTFSLLWRFDRGAAALAGLSLVCGVAVARALERIGASGVGLKWPNDVLHDAGKLAGILVEMHGDALGPSAIVIGIGLNVRLNPSMQAAIEQRAVDLESITGAAVDRSALLAALLASLVDALDRFAAEGFAPFRADWERRHAHQNRPVEVHLGAGNVERGTARGVAEDGALLVETAAGLRRFHSGEVSVRVASRQPAAA